MQSDTPLRYTISPIPIRIPIRIPIPLPRLPPLPDATRNETHVSSADDFLHEDLRGPELCAHEGRAHDTDEETDDRHVHGAVHETREGSGDGPRDKQDGGHLPSPEGITERANDETRQHGRRHRGDVGVVHLDLRHAQVLLDFRHERREGEP